MNNGTAALQGALWIGASHNVLEGVQRGHTLLPVSFPS